MDKIDFLHDDVRCGFMVPTAIKQAWAVQLNILSEIDRICKKYDITYFAEWGTLLGAVRHGGFVPWDDDIDISMKREDYDRFMQVADKELPSEFAVHNFKTKDNHWLFLARVVNTNQICFDKEHLDKNYNFPYIATVDIFLLDYLYADEEKERARCDEVKHIIALADKIIQGDLDNYSKEQYCSELEKKYNTKINRGLSNHDLGVCLYDLAEKQMARTKYEESDRIGQIFPWVLKGSRGLPKEYYESVIRLPFENTTIPVSARYHQVLSGRYGDYMKVHKIWGGHDYPYFEGQKKNLQAVADFKLPEFEFDKAMLRKADASTIYPEGSIKSTVFECKNVLLNYGTAIASAVENKQFDEVNNLVADCQQLAIDLGTYLEQTKGEDNADTVSVVAELEKLCNDLFALYELIQQIMNDSENVEKFEAIALQDILSDINEINLVICEKIIDKKQILFVVNKAKYLNGYEAYYRRHLTAIASGENSEITVVHVPHLYKDAYGQIMMSDEEIEKEVSTAEYDVAYNVRSWDAIDLQLMSPDVIYIQDPYDGENPCLTVPQNYYATNLQKYCKELVYVPCFDVDEFGEQDITTMYNTKHYITTPGVVCADKTIVQSEKMRELYIDIMTKFAGEDTRAVWTEKLCCRNNYLESIAESKSNENNADKATDSRKKLLYCIGENDFAENETIDEVIDSRIQILLQYSDKLDIYICTYPYSIFSEDEVHIESKKEYIESNKNETFIIKRERILEKIQKISNENKIFLTVMVNQNLQDFVNQFDAYYGCPSPLVLEFTRKNKPVMIANYDI